MFSKYKTNSNEKQKRKDREFKIFYAERKIDGKIKYFVKFYWLE